MKRSKLVFLVGGAIIGLGSFANQRALGAESPPAPCREGVHDSSDRRTGAAAASKSSGASAQKDANKDPNCQTPDRAGSIIHGGGTASSASGNGVKSSPPAPTHGGFGSTGASFLSAST
jgi:hypothetical protein